MNKCPNCNSLTGLREILYGMPDGPIDESKYSAGGCCISERDATLTCVECEWEGGFVDNIERLTRGV